MAFSQRNVRFASQDDFRTYEVMTPEPSPSFSTSTLESEGPVTPPRPEWPYLDPHPTSPASYIFVQHENQPPSPYKADGGVTLDNALVPSVSQSGGVELWRDTYSFERQLGSLHGITPNSLNEPATVPPQKKLVITCEYLPPGKQLVITPLPSSPHVTVRDVFMGIHRDLWKRMKQKEYDSIHPNHKAFIKNAYARRCKNVLGGPAVVAQEENDGVKYVDLLPYPQRFAGLYPGINSQYWKLVLDIPRNQPYPLQ